MPDACRWAALGERALPNADNLSTADGRMTKAEDIHLVAYGASCSVMTDLSPTTTIVIFAGSRYVCAMRRTSAGVYGAEFLHQGAEIVGAETVHPGHLQLLDDAAHARSSGARTVPPCSCGCRRARPRAAARSQAIHLEEDLLHRRPGDGGRHVGDLHPVRDLRAHRERAVRRVGVALLLADVGRDARRERSAEQGIGHPQRHVVRVTRIDDRAGRCTASTAVPSADRSRAAIASRRRRPHALHRRALRPGPKWHARLAYGTASKRPTT